MGRIKQCAGLDQLKRVSIEERIFGARALAGAGKRPEGRGPREEARSAGLESRGPAVKADSDGARALQQG